MPRHVSTHPARGSRVLLLAPLLGALLVVLAGCGADQAPAGPGDPAASSSAAGPASPTGPAAGPGSPSAKAAPEGSDAVELSIRLTGGSPRDGVSSVSVTRGQTVRLVGTSDTEDSLHVHGYDKTLELHPGQTTTTTFVADVSGSFEIETHESEKLVAQLVVS